MKHHLVLQRRVLAVATSLLLLGLLMASLVWAGSPPSPVAGGASPAGGDATRSFAQAEVGSPSARTDRIDAKRAVRDAWEKARDAGTYAFATNVTQVTYPALALANAGRGPERSELFLEGEIDQPARTLEFRMGQPGSDVSGEARIEGDRAYVRQAGGTWQEVEDFSASFAPDNDLLAFLGGIKDIADCGLQAASSEPVPATAAQIACYRFDLDGPALATYLRDRLERELAERGNLPLGVTLEASTSFRDMAGEGELWVDGRGLPLRLAMHLAFPAQRDGSHLEADVQTDFSGFPAEAAGPAASPDPAALAGTAPAGGAFSLPARAAQAAGTGGVFACVLGATALLLVYRRSRRLYRAVVIAVILAMVIGPLMQSERVEAFYEDRAGRSQDLWSLAASGQAVDPERAQDLEAAREAVAEALAPSWDPQQDPLAQALQTSAEAADARVAPSLGSGQAIGGTAGQSLLGPVAGPALSLEPPAGGHAPVGVTVVTGTITTTLDCPPDAADPDGDGVNNQDECIYGLLPNQADTDGDGLTDGQELHKLGTDGNSVDTDGDLITDTVEVEGFWYSGRQWYLNPKNPDTNNDGAIDSMECPALLDYVDPDENAIRDECDTDKDGIPNPFEADNDGDGVPDRVDLAPEQWADVNGVRSGAVANATPFDGDNPFLLTVEHLQEGWSVLVDLQIRPVNPAHLAYSMNVLDWPAGDTDGQIQHKADTTFANSNNEDIRNPDDVAGANGDMRLVPLLEVVMTGAQIPLRLTDPVMTATVGIDTPLSSTVTLRPGATNADTHFTFTYHEGSSLKVYDGPCSALGTLLATFTGTGGTLTGKSVVELADGKHSVVVSGDADKCAEIPDVVNGPYPDKMVDLSVLEPYGITVHDREEGGVHSVVALVPLNVATDDTGGGKSAFESHMVYWVDAASAWLEPQQMRVIWLVQMLTDSCSPAVKDYEEFYPGYKADHDGATDPEISEAYNSYYKDYCARNRTADETVPVQKYAESWTLAGLSVREDHGLDVAVAYANPDLTEYDNDALWTLSWGLGQVFIPQIDCEADGTSWNGEAGTCAPDGKSDLTVLLRAPRTDHSVRAIGNTTIQQRFDVTTTVPITDRWGIEAAAGELFPLRVESFRYQNRDYLGYHALKQTPRILEQYSHTLTPTLVFAREERYRVAGMEAITGTVGAGIAVDINTEEYPQETLVGLVWAPYRTNPDTNKWEVYPPTEYWDALGEELRAKFYDLYPEDSPEGNLGRVVVARAYAFTLLNGVVNGVQCTPDEPLCQVGTHSDASDVMIIKSMNAFTNGLNVAAVKTFLDYLARRDYVKRLEIRTARFDDLGKAVKNHASNYSTLFGAESSRVRFWGATILVAAGITLLTTIVLAAVMHMEGAQIAAVVIRDASLLIATHCLIHTIATQWAKFVRTSEFGQSFKGWSWSKSGGAAFSGKTFAAGVAQTLITVAITWAAFGIQFAVTNMKWGSMGADNAFATAMADMIVAVLLFIILYFLGPIGSIVQAIFGMLNAIASAICSALPAEAQASEAGSWFCRGVTGFLSNLLKWFFYSGTIMVEMDPKKYERLSLHDFDSELVDEEAGVVEGNQMRYTIGLTNTIDLVKVPITPFRELYGYQFNDDTLASSTFGYRWQTEKHAFHSELSRGTVVTEWEETDGGRPYYITPTIPSDPIALPQAGINRPIDGLYFSEAYAVPEQECWMFDGCSIQTERSTSHFDMGSDLIYDVLPATLDGFYQLARKGDGWALAWSQDGDLTFPTLYDADGDGLSHADDPDDSSWDADGDGLSDVYELNHGSNPLAPDTDDDGLTDVQEARFGSDPRSADGDGDGLLDCQEVFHEIVVVGDAIAQAACGIVVGAWSGGWTFVYGMEAGQQLKTLVTSNPVDVDSDADGLTDRQEQIYGYNPGVYSELNVLSLTSELSELAGGTYEPTDWFVAPDQSLYYAATVKNPLDNRQAEGLLWTVPSPVLQSGVQPEAFNLRPQAQVTMTGDLDVLPDAATGTYSLTQVAGALIADLSVEAHDASLWLRFDDPEGSIVFADSSGRVPAHDGVCHGTCPLQPADGRVGGALHLAGSGWVHSDAPASGTGYGVSLWFKTTEGGKLFVVKSADQQNTGIELSILSSSDWCPGCGLYNTSRIPGIDIENGTFSGSTPLNDGRWHHLVHTFGGNTGAQKIYLDGALMVSGRLTELSTAQTGVDIGGCDPSFIYPCTFSGSIDDVRLFDRGLTQQEVQALFEMPVFKMDFDQPQGWVDLSNNPTTVSCSGFFCPDHTTNAIGGAADFNGTQFLRVASSPALNLSAGRFTLSAWIYPRTRGGGDARDTFAQAVLGLQGGTASAYPTLQRVGKKIQFSLGTGTGSAWHSPYVSGEVLTENQWNHVAVTLDKEENGGTLRLYVNGELVGQPVLFPITTIAATNSFEIGRSSHTGRLDLTRYYQDDNHDNAGDFFNCYKDYYVEMCMAMNGTEVLDWKPEGCSATYPQYCGDCPPLPRGVDFLDTVTLRLWDDDGGTHCGSAPTNQTNDDDRCEIPEMPAGGSSSLTLTTNDAGFTSRTFTFGGCDGNGDFRLTYSHDSIPFYGTLDEVQIFAQLLDPDSVKRLYMDVITALHLPLDEPAGATAFQDMSYAYVPAACNGDACPTSGIPGRLNQAALFDGQNDVVEVPLDVSETNYALSLWFKTGCANCGIFSVDKGHLGSDHDRHVYLNAGNVCARIYSNETKCTSGTNYADGQWHHVVHTFGGSVGGQQIYLDGVLKVSGTKSTSDFTWQDGINIGFSKDATLDYFAGAIDDVWILSMALPAARVAELYESAPSLHLRFDEAHGATQFADNATAGRFGTCTGTGCPLAGEAVRGQIGLAAQFDGVDDHVTIGNFGAFNTTTVSAWVYRTGATTARETIVSYKENTFCGFVLALESQRPKFWVRVGSTWQYTTTAGSEVPLNQWVHLAGTYDGKTIRLYRNGLQVATKAAAGAMTQCTDTTAIGSHNLGGVHFFPGAIDQVRVYGHALTATQIWDQYQYESAWTEDRQSRDITVDDDLPAAQVLMADGSYLAGQAIVVGVTAGDPTSGIAAVELGVQAGTGPISWAPAARCTESQNQPEGAWCAAFTPSAQGVYSLYARATDRVGHTGSAGSGVPVYVDDAPPVLTLDQTSYELVNAAHSEEDPNTWVVHLSGTVSDPEVAAGVPGSGVPADSVHVTLRDASGAPLGDARQTATLSGNTWSLDYAFRMAEPDGCYTVEAEAVDRVAGLPGLDAEQVVWHTAVVSSGIALQAAAPAVLLDQQPAFGNGHMGPGVTGLSGETFHRPVPVEVDLAAATGAHQTHVWLTCQHGNEGSWYTLFDLPAGALAADSTREWAEKIHHWSLCRVELTTTAPSGGVSGVVKVCGTEIASWNGNFSVSRTVEFVVHSSSCGTQGCPAGLQNEGAGVQAVGLQMHLPFELPQATEGTILPDASGGGHDGILHTGTGDTANKAVPGLVGAYALQFDGTNDYAEVPLNVSETDYALSLWFKTGCADCGIFSVDQGVRGTGGHDRHVYLSSGNVCARIWSDETKCTSGTNYADGQWHHVVHTFGGTEGGQKIYLDGVLKASGTKASSDFVAQTGINIAFSNDAALDYFSGLLDEVMVFTRALSARDVTDLYGAGWQGPPVAGVQGVDIAFRSVLPGSAFVNEVPLESEILHLPFEDTPDGNGSLVLRDVSGVGPDGYCGTDACPVPGQPSPSGSAAHFDGVNDSVRIAQVAGQGTTDYLTIAAWIYPSGASADEGTFIARTNQWAVACSPYGAIAWMFNNASPGWRVWYIPGYLAPLNQWTHMAVVYDAGVIRTYANGVLVDTFAGSGSISNAGALDVGGWPGYASWFAGGLDEVRLFTRALTGDEIKALYAGSGPVLAHFFEEPWATDGTILPDASGWEHDGTLHTGTGDAANKAVTGQAGSHGLQLDGVNDYLELPDHATIDFAYNQDFGVALWVKADLQVNTQNTDNDIVEKWSGSGGYPYVIRYLRASGTIVAARWDGSHGANVYSNVAINDDKFHHVAFVKQGGTLYLYIDGVQRGTAADTTTGDTTNTSALYIGRRGNNINYFKGTVDDLRIYPRGLPAQEVADLYHAGWQAATLAQSGDGVERTTWTVDVPVGAGTTTLPPGLEGSYQVEMRSQDVAGHAEMVAAPSLLWRGEADNVPPRAILCRRLVSGNTYRYVAVAQDYNLAETGFSSPCAISSRSYFRSPWYAAVVPVGTQKLYDVRADCQMSGSPPLQATACDSAGNCATVGLTTGGACDSILASQAAPPLAESVATTPLSTDRADLRQEGTGAPGKPRKPFITFEPTVITATHYTAPSALEITGLFTGTTAVSRVDVAIGNSSGQAVLSDAAASWPFTRTWSYAYYLPDGPLPDGITRRAVATASLQGRRTARAKAILTLDVVPPAPITLTLTANGLPVEPGATIPEPQADLALAWTPSSDGSGLAPYLAAWRFEDAYTTTLQTSLHDPAGPLQARAVAGEAQRVTTGLASRDVHGNARWQAFGSVIVDGPLTPDYISLSPGAEGDITGSTCTLLGADRRISSGASSGRWTDQRLYATWDHQALRFTWTGANWSGDGDLFLYLDTAAGGTDTTFFPYTVTVSGTLVTLPPEFEADALVWVRDTTTATLLLWDGNQWAAEAALSPEHYLFDGGRSGGQTDLHLPFDLLGTAAGSPLGLVAFAAEEPAPGIGLRIWATLPLANPANSSRVNTRRVLALPGITVLMAHAYRWAALGDGVCPNGTNGVLMAEQHNDAWLQLWGESSTPAAVSSGAARGLFWVGDPQETLNEPGVRARFGMLLAAHPPVPDGQMIGYTVHYRNEGTHTLAGAWLDLSAYGPMQVAPGTIDLGDVPPGGEGSFTFQATVDRSLSPLGLAAVLGRLYAATNGPEGRPLEWAVGIYRIDTGAPGETGLLRSARLVGPEKGWLRGTARDESGISQVELEITSPSGLISTFACGDPDPASGEWSCSWDATALNGGARPANGDEFSVRLRATDRFGHTSPWGLPHVVRVDAQPPTITLDEVDSAYASRLVRGNRLRLIGEALDNDAVASVTLCLEGEACQTADLLSPGSASSGWSGWITADGAMDYVTRTLTIGATDRLGNTTGDALTVPVVFDNVPPVLVANQLLAEVPLSSTQTVLTGSVADGGPGVEVSVRVQAPHGDLTRLAAARGGSAWWFDLPALTPGLYTLWVDAQDLAGNATTAGPFSVDVTCTNAAPLVTSLSAEPVAGWPLFLTLTIVLSNAGPDPLPAGLPVALGEGTNEIGYLVSTLPLAPGESQALSLPWAPTAAGDYAIGVTAGKNAVLPNGPLCAAPPTAYFSLPVRDGTLYYGGNLISPRVNPANPDVQVVQRGIDGPYSLLLGYDGGLLAYYPDRPQDSTLTTVDALHGYWVQVPITATTWPSATISDESAATWRMAGEVLPEDQSLALASGWNLAAYLPQQPLSVTTALEGIAGQYGAVLGFDRTALSYYPDVDDSYNTLSYMAPGYGYWISATQALSFAYPTTNLTNTLPVTATRTARARLSGARYAEWLASVQPTYEWANFYGPVSLPDGTPIPTGTVILAVDPQGAICGATAVRQPGQFGLLACYGDDPDTVADEGALPGDTIRLFVSTDSMNPDGEFIGEGVWLAHGSRWLVGPPPTPQPDLAITKYVTPEAALPGSTITYTIAYTNAGDLTARGVVFTDVLPTEILSAGFAYWGAPITPTAGSPAFSWEVADLAPGDGGGIVVTGVVSPGLTGPLAITNTAIITAPLEARPEDNLAEAVLQVIPPSALVVDLAITKDVVPQAALPGAAITYTLVYINAGNAVAEGVVISDVLPTEIEATGFSYWGMPITPTAGSPAFSWEVADLAPGEGGVITVAAILSPQLTGTLTITNTAIITAPLEARPEDNLAEAVLHVILGVASLVLAFLRAAQ